MRGYPGNELQVVHSLHLFSVFPIPVADLALLIIEGEAFQGKERPDHVLANPLGLLFVLGPHQAVDRKPRMPPRKDPLRPFRAQEFLADEVGQDLAGKELPEPRVVDPGDLMENKGQTLRADLRKKEGEEVFVNAVLTTPLFTLKAPNIRIRDGERRVKIWILARVKST